jgi:2-polyprenyl-3-methyl-5-hydroxy-6-metoxy-1,4-benzoquinol methylase
MDFGDGVVLHGEYDMRKYLRHYDLPADLSGQSVLDIGTANGFFAFECARRGAAVTAIDVHRDGLFEAIRDALGVQIRFVTLSIYDLDATFGRFDLVVCGSLLLHLPDLFGAIERIRGVCRRAAIVSTATTRERWWSRKAVCEFIGTTRDEQGATHRVFWNVTPTALRRMLLAAGFARAHETGRFALCSEPGAHGYVVPHVAMRAEVA